ncbi:MAG: hypothetical protein GAK34_03859 [Delftia tsuruhatensis]|nr:MAG: hypothetical protein GAK34_03859 [Delftia tsuruhatensis]
MKIPLQGRVEQADARLGTRGGQRQGRWHRPHRLVRLPAHAGKDLTSVMGTQRPGRTALRRGAAEQLVVPDRLLLEVRPLPAGEVQRHTARVVAPADQRAHGPARCGGIGQGQLGQQGREGFRVVEGGGCQHRSAGAHHLVLLVAQAAGQGPAVGQAPVQLAEDAQVLLRVVEGGQAAQQQAFVRAGARVVDAAEAAQAVLVAAHQGAELIGDIVLADIGIALAGNARVALHGRARILGLVDQPHAVAQLVAEVEDAGVGLLLPAGHGRRPVLQRAERSGRRLLAGAVAVVVGIGELGLQARNAAGQPQELHACVECAEILIGLAPLELRIGVVDEGIAPRVVHGQSRGQLLAHGAGDGDGRTPRLVVARLQLVGPFALEAGVLGVHDDGARDGIGTLRGGLRAAEHLDALHIPDRGRAKEHLGVVEVVPIQVDGGARHRAAPEDVLAVVGALRVLPSDDGRAHRVGVDHVGHIVQHLVDRGIAGLLPGQVLAGLDRHGGGRVLELAPDLFSADHDRFKRVGFPPGTRRALSEGAGRRHQGRECDGARPGREPAMEKQIHSIFL